MFDFRGVIEYGVEDVDGSVNGWTEQIAPIILDIEDLEWRRGMNHAMNTLTASSNMILLYQLQLICT